MEKETKTASLPAAPEAIPEGRSYWILLAALFLLPRIVRLLYPYVWFEDPFYLYAARLVEHGLVPYRDFNHVQLPGAEYLLSALYSLFGTSYRAAEIFSQTAVYANTWLIYLTGRKLCGGTAGLSSAVIFSCSSLVFRYHVWERELLVLLLVTLVFYLLLRWEKLDRPRSLALGLIFAAGIFIKLTTVVPLAAALLFIAVVRKEVKSALVTGLSALVFTLLAVSWFFSLAGAENFFIQAFFVHFVKGVTSDSRLAALLYPLYTLDITAVLGILGVFFWKKKFPAAAWYPALVLLVYWAFLTFVSHTVWPHNFVYFLPFLSLSGGVFLAALYEMAWTKRKFLAPFSLAAAALLLLASAVPLKNANWVMGGAYGFGYIPRKDVAEISSFIRANTASTDLLLLPQHIAAESGRETVLSETMDTPGLIGWVEGKRKNKAGLREILGLAKFKTYTQMTREVSELGWGSAASLLKQRKLKYVVLTTVPADNCPFSAQYLRSLGYAPARQVGGYEAWSLVPELR